MGVLETATNESTCGQARNMKHRRPAQSLGEEKYETIPAVQEYIRHWVCNPERLSIDLLLELTTPCLIIEASISIFVM